MNTRVLLESKTVRVAVCRYAEGVRHAPHRDRHSRISLVLRGGYREESRRGTISMRPGDVQLKSRRAKHDDEFGETLLATIEFLDDDPFDAAATPDVWQKRDDAFALRHATSFLEAALSGDARAAEAAALDLAAAGERAATSARAAPAWVEQLHAELAATSLGEVDVAARAREAGAHPAHASRLFRRCYGMSITEHAQAQSVRRAFGAPALGEAPLSEIALNAGFYDQSHMTRLFRRVMGRTPGAARALLAAAG